MNEEDFYKYYQKGGEYVIPIGIFNDLLGELEDLQKENIELSHIVANKVISDYDIDTPLKKELGEANLKIVSLEDALRCYKQEKEDLIEWLETYAEFNADEQPIEKTLNEVLDKVRGINNDWWRVK